MKHWFIEVWVIFTCLGNMCLGRESIGACQPDLRYAPVSFYLLSANNKEVANRNVRVDGVLLLMVGDIGVGSEGMLFANADDLRHARIANSVRVVISADLNKLLRKDNALRSISGRTVSVFVRTKTYRIDGFSRILLDLHRVDWDPVEGPNSQP